MKGFIIRIVVTFLGLALVEFTSFKRQKIVQDTRVADALEDIATFVKRDISCRKVPARFIP